MILLFVLQLFLWLSDGAAEVEVGGETLEGALTRVNADVGALQPLTSFRQGEFHQLAVLDPITRD